MNKEQGYQILADLCLGKNPSKPGLYWYMEGFHNFHLPKTEDLSEVDGKRLLIPRSYRHKIRRQKDRPKGWLLTDHANCRYREFEEGENDVFVWETDKGTLTGRRHDNHFFEYPVKTVEDLDLWREVHEGLTYSVNPSFSSKAEETQGFGLQWSPLQQLLQFDVGLENVYYFFSDAPKKMDALIDVMQAKCVERLELGLSSFPNAASVGWTENTSSSSISPDYFRRYSMRHLKVYADNVHANGGRLTAHMCGLLKDLLDSVAETEIDGIDCLTPPPLGDVPFELARSVFKPDFVIRGRLNAHFWVGRNRHEISNALRRIIYPELLATPFILLATTDAVEGVSHDNIMAFAEAAAEFAP